MAVTREKERTFIAFVLFVGAILMIPVGIGAWNGLFERQVRDIALNACYYENFPMVACAFTAAGDLPVEYIEPVKLAKAIAFIKGSRTPKLAAAPQKSSGNCLAHEGTAFCFADNAVFHLPPVYARGAWSNAVRPEIDMILATFPGYHEDPNKGRWRVPY